jgi:hypothetical protein
MESNEVKIVARQSEMGSAQKRIWFDARNPSLAASRPYLRLGFSASCDSRGFAAGLPHTLELVEAQAVASAAAARPVGTMPSMRSFTRLFFGATNGRILADCRGRAIETNHRSVIVRRTKMDFPCLL